MYIYIYIIKIQTSPEFTHVCHITKLVEFPQIFTAPSCPSTPFAVSAGSGPAVTACSGAAVAGVTGSVRGAAVGTGGTEVGTALVLDLGDLWRKSTGKQWKAMGFQWFSHGLSQICQEKMG